ncbi:lipoprotein [Burkholderiaceae bacterium 16]|nr:lipoprotein [Burkholderiaceae bacterium 16]
MTACTVTLPPAPPAARAPAPPAAAPAVVRERPTPIVPRDIDISANCQRTEEDGFREDAHMQVVSNDVRSLSWKLWVGRRGSCHFDLAEFRQVRKTPHIELRAIDDSGCTLMVWQDPRRVTLAHAHCEQHCTPGIYEQAWPVLFNPRSGTCAQIR